MEDMCTVQVILYKTGFITLSRFCRSQQVFKVIGVGTLFKLGEQRFRYENLYLSRRAPYDYLAEAHLKEIYRLRCFVVINFHITVFNPVFRNGKKIHIPQLACQGNHFLTERSDLSWRKYERR